MKIYVINLASAKERYHRISEQLRELGLTYKRFDAINGLALSESEMEALCSIEAVRSNPTWLTKGAIGCALSHWRVYQQIVADDTDVALVLEDDVIFPPNFPQILDAIESQILDNEVILLYFQSFKKMIFASQNKTPLFGKYELASPTSLDGLGAAGAYLIKKQVAQQMAEKLTPIRAAADTWHYFHKIGAFETLRCVLPFAATSSLAESTIDYIKKDNFAGRLKSFLARHNVLFFRNFLTWRRKKIWQKLTNYAFTK
jgi:glycosyl transferase family 25